MRIVVGLGNPGPGHVFNRHNIGFLTADILVRRHEFGPWRARFHGLAAEGELAGEKIVALKPETYMNDSGRAVAAAAQFYKLQPEQVFVIHDEIDLVAGKVKVKQGGGAAGHNGLRSIDAHLGPMYWRVRLGIGHPGSPELVRHYVLQNFPKEEQPLISKVVEATVLAFPVLIAGDANGFMNKVNLAVNPPKPKPDPKTKPDNEPGGDPVP